MRNPHDHLGGMRCAYCPSVDDGIDFSKAVSMTHQSFKEECDVNNIIKNLGPDGLAMSAMASEARYGDFSSVVDYQTSMQLVLDAQERFEAMPAQLRARFQNDPAVFLEFAEDPKNQRELVRLGLATMKPEVEKKLAADAALKKTAPASPKGPGAPAVGEGPSL